MRTVAIAVAMTLLAGCGSMEYKDTNRAVDANPLCAARPDRPGEPVSADCERKTETTWSSEGSKQGEPIDFSGKDDD